MHPCLCVDEIIRLIAQELVTDSQHATAVALACCRKCFEDPVMDVLWRAGPKFTDLLKTLPGDIWNPGQYQVRWQRLSLLSPSILNYLT
jgi:hypothetical protein